MRLSVSIDWIMTTKENLRRFGPGISISAVVAVAASFLSEHYRAPVMLFALLLGMAVNFLSDEGTCKPGIEFTAREVLRVGVALLGIRISFAQISALGWEPIILVMVSVLITILVSILAARVLGFKAIFGMLTGGATAICGASAALALSAALPSDPRKEQATLFTVIGISALSTIAMIAYPMIVQTMQLDPVQAGMFLGGTIHDVAQVVGAGYSMSTKTGDTATVIKLMRVAMLLPVILCTALFTRSRGAGEGGKRPPLFPWFGIGFLVFAAINSIGWIAAPIQNAGNEMSRWCLVIAISALGMKTHLKDILTVGFRPVALMVGETVFLACLVLFSLRHL
ncbi:Membrane protein [Georgfuchsia toluolica]|uniref:Membrane protein n=1 Tax=Georgfuchsia toluolica TaxID=424218 RepID=A0A916J780_9PROT|nr:Membrane protein [Georgfuchsia toluolica]